MKIKTCKTCGEPIKNPHSTLQKYCCYFCSINDPDIKKKIKTKKVKIPRKKTSKKIRSEEEERLTKRADSLYQTIGKILKPCSIVSGEPTEVMHHYIYKSQSKNLRYDLDNGIPLTNREHTRHHLSGDPRIVSTITLKMGEEWVSEMQLRRKITCKLTKEYLELKVQELSLKLESLVCSKSLPF